MDYKKILEGVVDIINTTEKSDIGFANICAYIGEKCPELKESEDEKIRNEIIDFINYQAENGNLTDEQSNLFLSWLFWLEKQGEQKFEMKTAEESLGIDSDTYNKIVDECIFSEQKPTNSYCQENCKGYQETGKCFADWECKAKREAEQKPADKVEPKFKIGDWVMLDRPVLITKVEDMPYNTHQYWTSDGTWFGDATKAKLWTIQDAKDGDVLACESGWTCIFKTLVNDETFSSYCFMDNTKWFCETGSESHTLNKAYNGEIYPATKEQRDTLMKVMADAGYTFDFEKKELKKIEQKPVELCPIFRIGDIIERKDGQGTHFKITSMPGNFYHCEKMIYSEDDISYCDIPFKNQDLFQISSDFEKKPVEWSEEDEEILQGIWDEILANKHEAKEYEWKTYDKFLDWLKSLSPQNRWKPSEEQMEALKGVQEGAFRLDILVSLYNDLKKLKV